jgi:hypothetical protein
MHLARGEAPFHWAPQGHNNPAISFILGLFLLVFTGRYLPADLEFLGQRDVLPGIGSVCGPQEVLRCYF